MWLFAQRSFLDAAEHNLWKQNKHRERRWFEKRRGETPVNKTAGNRKWLCACVCVVILSMYIHWWHSLAICGFLIDEHKQTYTIICLAQDEEPASCFSSLQSSEKKTLKKHLQKLQTHNPAKQPEQASAVLWTTVRQKVSCMQYIDFILHTCRDVEHLFVAAKINVNNQIKIIKWCKCSMFWIVYNKMSLCRSTGANYHPVPNFITTKK